MPQEFEVYFSVTPSQERSNLTDHCGVCPSIWLVGQSVVCPSVDSYNISNFQTFVRFQKFQNQNVFQAILSNSDFWFSADLA